MTTKWILAASEADARQAYAGANGFYIRDAANIRGRLVDRSDILETCGFAGRPDAAEILDALDKCFRAFDEVMASGPISAADSAGFVKHDAGKQRLDLLPFDALLDVGRVLTHGAAKYPADNWRKCSEPRRYLGAALRHLFAHATGERMDPDSGLPHLAHAACNVLFLLALDRGAE